MSVIAAQNTRIQRLLIGGRTRLTCLREWSGLEVTLMRWRGFWVESCTTSSKAGFQKVTHVSVHVLIGRSAETVVVISVPLTETHNTMF